MIIFFEFVTPNSISNDVELNIFSISKIDFSREDQCLGRVLRFVFLAILTYVMSEFQTYKQNCVILLWMNLLFQSQRIQDML